MKTYNFTLLLILIFGSPTSVFGQTPTIAWQRTWNAAQAVQCREIVNDDIGNIYVAGTYRATVDLDPGPNTINSTAVGSYNGFLVKLDAAGLYLWSIAFPTELSITGIEISQNGNIIIGGRFQNSLDVDPGVGETILTSNGLSDAFVARYTATGNLIWAKSYGSELNNGILGLSEAPDGSIYLGGEFADTTDFDPGAAEFILTTTSSATDGYILKLNANGDFIYAKQIGGTGSNQVNSLSVDGEGNIIATGTYSGQIVFDANGQGIEFSVNNYTDAFIAKYTGSGSFIWAKRITGQNNINLSSLELDNESNIYMSGYFAGTGDFDPGSEVFLLEDVSLNGELFILKLNIDGNLIWAKQIGVPESAELAADLSVDAEQNLYLTGYIIGNVDFDLGPNIVNLPQSGLADAFALKMNASAEFIWAARFGGNQSDFGNRIIPYTDGSVYLSGHRLPNGDSPHSFGFLNKYAPTLINAIPNETKEFGFNLYPNPSSGFYNIVAQEEITKIVVCDLTGKRLAAYTPNNKLSVLDLTAFPKGVYILQIFSGNTTEAAKIMKN